MCLPGHSARQAPPSQRDSFTTWHDSVLASQKRSKQAMLPAGGSHSDTSAIATCAR